MSSIGVLLTNTGSPLAPTAESVRPYLEEFLSDRRVIALPKWLWRPILHTFVLSFRPARSARLYKNIWTPAGSPLITISQSIEKKLRIRLEQSLGPEVDLALGMRYGSPSIHAAMAGLQTRGVQRLLVVPMFPQYSRTTTESAFDAVEEARWDLSWHAEIKKLRHYYDHAAYIDALVESISEFWEHHSQPERLLFSFHGIPQSYERAGDPYAAHCRTTAEETAQKLGLGPDEWSIAFQSRFGPVRWLQPYTDRVLAQWGHLGPRHIQVVSPGFSVDCLETIDELEREGRDTYLEAGGDRFEYIPALNDRMSHIEALAQVVTEELAPWRTTAADRQKEKP